MFFLLSVVLLSLCVQTLCCQRWLAFIINLLLFYCLFVLPLVYFVRYFFMFLFFQVLTNTRKWRYHSGKSVSLLSDCKCGEWRKDQPVSQKGTQCSHFFSNFGWHIWKEMIKVGYFTFFCFSVKRFGCCASRRGSTQVDSIAESENQVWISWCFKEEIIRVCFRNLYLWWEEKSQRMEN